MQFLNLKEKNNDQVHLRLIIDDYLTYWKWYVLAIVIFTLFSIGGLYFTANNYEVSALVLLKKDEGPMSDASIDGKPEINEGGNYSLANEIGVLKSKLLMEKVINKLDINVQYFKNNNFKKNEIYGHNNPVKVNFFEKDSIFNQRDTVIKITPISESKFYLESENGDYLEIHDYGRIISTKMGDITVIPKNGNGGSLNESTIVVIKPIIEVVKFYSEKVSIDKEDLNSTLVKLQLVNPIKDRSIDLLNGIISEYNKYALDYKRTLTRDTDEFINERIVEISNSLSNMDKGVEDFKKKNNLSNIAFESDLNLKSNSDLEPKINILNTQIQDIDFLLSHIEIEGFNLIPSNIGIDDETTSKNISDYNSICIELKRILVNSSELNPVVVNLTSELSRRKSSLITSLKGLKSSLSYSLSQAISEKNSLISKKQLAPKQEREYQEIKRQQQTVETLYLFMLQKREENAILTETKITKLTVVDSPNGSDSPVSPKPLLLLMLGPIMGIVLPMAIIYVKNLLNDMIISVEDIEQQGVAQVIGDIPISNLKSNIVVTQQAMTSIAEAFRILRTKIIFNLKEKNNGKIVFVTSTLGGEGKTFVTANLASAIGLLEKKVLIIEADIRKPKLKNYFNLVKENGLTDYLSNTKIDIPDLINCSKNQGVDIISGGNSVTNPSELLSSKRFNNIIDFGQRNYDYVIVDTAPIGLVADTLYLKEHADILLYVIKANNISKSQFRKSIIPNDKNELSNLFFLLNKSNLNKSNYGYKYGY